MSWSIAAGIGAAITAITLSLKGDMEAGRQWLMIAVLWLIADGVRR